MHRPKNGANTVVILKKGLLKVSRVVSVRVLVPLPKMKKELMTLTRERVIPTLFGTVTGRRRGRSRKVVGGVVLKEKRGRPQSGLTFWRRCGQRKKTMIIELPFLTTGRRPSRCLRLMVLFHRRLPISLFTRKPRVTFRVKTCFRAGRFKPRVLTLKTLSTLTLLTVSITPFVFLSRWRLWLSRGRLLKLVKLTLKTVLTRVRRLFRLLTVLMLLLLMTFLFQSVLIVVIGVQVLILLIPFIILKFTSSLIKRLFDGEFWRILVTRLLLRRCCCRLVARAFRRRVKTGRCR